MAEIGARLSIVNRQNIIPSGGEYRDANNPVDITQPAAGGFRWTLFEGEV
jgi:hypothetical protein